MAGGVGVSLPTRQLFKSLTATLLVPLVLGKVCHHSFSRAYLCGLHMLAFNQYLWNITWSGDCFRVKYILDTRKEVGSN